MDNLFQNPIYITGDALFVTDTHFGSPSEQESRVREELLIALLNQEKSHIRHLFLLGDIFDFWFEYRDVVPKGNFRLFSTLYDLHQAGVKIYYFTGNHDMWVQDYFTESFGCQVFYRQQAFVINGKRCLVGHGDGIGGKQRRYLLIKNIFGFKPNRVLYSMLHPRQAFSIARFFSRKSRASHDESLFTFQGEREFQVQFAREVLKREPVDFFIYGHRHTPAEYALNDEVTFFNVGDWISNFSYLMFPEGEKPVLHYFKQ